MENSINNKGIIDKTTPSREVNSMQVFIDNTNEQTEKLKLQTQENLIRCDDILKKISDLLDVDFIEFKKKTNGRPEENKLPSFYGYKDLLEDKENEYLNLTNSISSILRENMEIENKNKKNNRRMELIKKGETEEGRKNIILDLENPKEIEILIELDALIESGILEESEIIKSLNNRISKLKEIYSKDESEIFFKGPHGDKMEYEAQLQLNNLPKTVLEKIKNSREISPKLKSLLELDLLSL